MRINKVPFFLWLTEKRDDLKLDFQNKTIESEELGKSSIKELSVYIAFLMRYFPFFILFSFFYFPKNKIEFYAYGISFLCAIFLVFLYKKQFILKLVVVLICFLNLYLLLILDDYASNLDIGITFFVENIIFLIFVLDLFVFKGFKNWYYLENFKNEAVITLSQQHKRRLLFLFKPKRGLNVKKTVYIKGYFLRIENDDI
jgi:hypothetical protein